MIVLCVCLTTAHNSNVNAQTPENLKGKEVGLNFRNLWFGSSAEVIIRKPKAENSFKRRTFSFNGYFRESNNELTPLQIDGLPEAYKSDLSNLVNIGVALGTEKRINLIDESVYFYHGPTALFSAGMTQRRSSFAGTSATKRHSSSVNLGLGVGYFGGIGIKLTDRFSVQIDNMLSIWSNANLINETEATYNTDQRTEEVVTEIKDRLNMAVTIPTGNVSRIWVVLKF